MGTIYVVILKTLYFFIVPILLDVPEGIKLYTSLH